jgi:hypothetical protein
MQKVNRCVTLQTQTKKYSNIEKELIAKHENFYKIGLFKKPDFLLVRWLTQMQYIAMYFDNSYAIVAQLSSSYGS